VACAKRQKGYAMEQPTTKVTASVGASQFNMEGREEIVTAAFHAWLNAVNQPATHHPRTPVAPMGQTTTMQGGTPLPLVEQPRDDGNGAVTANTYTKIFGMDDRTRVLTLKIRPEGDTAEADALLLLLYGYRQLTQTDEVLVGKLKDSLALTGGLGVGRIDRIIGRYVDDRLVLKVGKQGPGGKYRLTQTGLARAEMLAKSLSEHIV
jgi:hypothetical protein